MSRPCSSFTGSCELMGRWQTGAVEPPPQLIFNRASAPLPLHPPWWMPIVLQMSQVECVRAESCCSLLFFILLSPLLHHPTTLLPSHEGLQTGDRTCLQLCGLGLGDTSGGGLSHRLVPPTHPPPPHGIRFHLERALFYFKQDDIILLRSRLFHLYIVCMCPCPSCKNLERAPPPLWDPSHQLVLGRPDLIYPRRGAWERTNRIRGTCLTNALPLSVGLSVSFFTLPICGAGGCSPLSPVRSISTQWSSTLPCWSPLQAVGLTQAGVGSSLMGPWGRVSPSMDATMGRTAFVSASQSAARSHANQQQVNKTETEKDLFLPLSGGAFVPPQFVLLSIPLTH
ncbi:unnamed protein product [Pleuronectes platessa]|uniref:Uncharacterized protein n=1 Tax=Pleuronectes platessa TaxID=8262 RepID=A0A9N7UKX1_PLEPL|nr:unnamed protein product [Pleuronectes platessa]